MATPPQSPGAVRPRSGHSKLKTGPLRTTCHNGEPSWGPCWPHRLRSYKQHQGHSVSSSCEVARAPSQKPMAALALCPTVTLFPSVPSGSLWLLPASLSPINHVCRIYFLQQFISANAIWVCPQVGRMLCCCQSRGAWLYCQVDRHDLPAPPRQTPGLAEAWAGTLGIPGISPIPSPRPQGPKQPGR